MQDEAARGRQSVMRVGVSRAGMTGVHGAGSPAIAVAAGAAARECRNAMRVAVSRTVTTNEIREAARGDPTAGMKRPTDTPTKAAEAGAVTLECRNAMKAVDSKVVRTIEVPAAARGDRMAGVRTMITAEPADSAEATHGCRIETSMDALRAGRAVRAARMTGMKMRITRITVNPPPTAGNAEATHGCRIETSMDALRATTIKAGRAVRAARMTGITVRITRITANPAATAENAEATHGCRIGTRMDASRAAKMSEAVRADPTIRMKRTTGSPVDLEAGAALPPWMKTSEEKSHHGAGGLIRAGNCECLA